MDQEAREQPWAWDDDETQLLKKREGVQLKPVLRDLSIDQPVELEPVERDFPTGWREPLELTAMGAFDVDTLRDEVAVPDVSSTGCRGSAFFFDLLAAFGGSSRSRQRPAITVIA